MKRPQTQFYAYAMIDSQVGRSSKWKFIV